MNADFFNFFKQLANPLETKKTDIDRHEDFLAGNQCGLGQDAGRGRRIDNNKIELVQKRFHAFPEAFPAIDAAQKRRFNLFQAAIRG